MRERYRITVYYDGACPKCVRDRHTYESLAADSGRNVEWFDITDRDDELRHLGVDPQRALHELHVRDEQGHMLRSIDAYILLMRRVRRLRPVAWLIGMPLLRPAVGWLYQHTVRRRLQREGRLGEHLQ